MTIPQSGEATPQNRLRVWPGVVAVVLQWTSRFGVKALVPGIKGFGLAVMGSLFFALAIIIWWVFFSRTRRAERFGALALLAVAIGGTWVLKHVSIWLPRLL